MTICSGLQVQFRTTVNWTATSVCVVFGPEAMWVCWVVAQDEPIGDSYLMYSDGMRGERVMNIESPFPFAKLPPHPCFLLSDPISSPSPLLPLGSWHLDLSDVTLGLAVMSIAEDEALALRTYQWDEILHVFSDCCWVFCISRRRWFDTDFFRNMFWKKYFEGVCYKPSVDAVSSTLPCLLTSIRRHNDLFPSFRGWIDNLFLVETFQIRKQAAENWKFFNDSVRQLLIFCNFCRADLLLMIHTWMDLCCRTKPLMWPLHVFTKYSLPSQMSSRRLRQRPSGFTYL